MDLRKGSKDILIKQLVKYHNLLTTNPDLWTFSPVKVVDAGAPMNARVKLTPAPANTQYKDSCTFNYKRLDLPTIGSSTKVIRFATEEGKTVHDHFPDLLKQLGVLWDANDLEPTPLVKIDNTDSFTLTLTAKSGCLAWYGTTTLRVDPLPDIGLYVNVDNFTWNQQ
jgi:hypothetical protein